MIDISVQNLVKSFDSDQNILNGVSFDVQAGERVGLLGKNGAGKTTLFKILTGELSANSGEIAFAPDKRVGLISQIPVYPDGYTVEDVLRTAFSRLADVRREMEQLEAQMQKQATKDVLRRYDELSTRYTVGGGYETDTDTDKICNGLGIPADMRAQLFDRLSGGEKTRVNLARLLLEKTDILLLDEPTNHLDMKSVEWLEDYISKFKGTVLAISHDRYFLDRVVTRIVEIHDGQAEFYNGNYSFYVQEKQARFDLQLKQYEKEQAKLGQLGFTLERMKGWGINNRSLYRRAMSIQHRMDRIEQTDRPTKDKTMRARFQERDFFGDEVFSVKGLAKSYGDRTLFSGVELTVTGGERVALLGDNGTGKSTFLRVLLGEEPGEGKIKFGPTVKWAYLPQIIRFSHPERTLLDTMLYEKNCTVQTARDRLGAFMFEGEDVFKLVGSLSGGEQSRLRLCMLMDESINLLILDEPTNHLDIASREWVEDAIEQYEGALLFVSHDRYFVNKFATRVWVLENGQIRDFPCGYEKYRSILAHEAMAAPPPEKEKKPRREKPHGTDRTLEKQVRSVERQIALREEEIKQYDASIEAAASDYQKLSDLMARRQQTDDALSKLMEQWETLSTQLEEQT
jgi:ATP-binding cassette subfamily F protein 3